MAAARATLGVAGSRPIDGYAAEGRRAHVSAGCRATPHEAWLDLTVREGPELDVRRAPSLSTWGEAGVDVAAEQATVVLRQRDPSGAAWRLETAAGGCGPAPPSVPTRCCGGMVGGGAPPG